MWGWGRNCTWDLERSIKWGGGMEEGCRGELGCQFSKVREERSFSEKPQALETPPLPIPLPHITSEQDSPHLTHFSLKSPKLSILLVPCSHDQPQFVSIGPWCCKVKFAWTRSGSPILLFHGPICTKREAQEMVQGSIFRK